MASPSMYLVDAAQVLSATDFALYAIKRQAFLQTLYALVHLIAKYNATRSLYT